MPNPFFSSYWVKAQWGENMKEAVKQLFDIKGVNHVIFVDQRRIEISGRLQEVNETTKKEIDIWTDKVYSTPQLRRIVKEVMQTLKIHTLKKRQGGISGDTVVFEGEFNGVECSIYGNTDYKRRLGILSRVFNCKIKKVTKESSYTSTSYACSRTK